MEQKKISKILEGEEFIRYIEGLVAKQNQTRLNKQIKKVNTKDYVNINNLIKEKDRVSFNYFLDNMENLTLMNCLNGSNYLIDWRNYREYLMLNVCLDFILKNIHLEDYTLDQEGTLWIKFSGNKEATDLINKWETKLINGDIKMDGFGYLSKSNCWNHANFWMSIFYLLLLKGKDDKVKTFRLLSLFNCLEVKIIKEWDNLRTKNFTAKSWSRLEKQILDYFNYDYEFIQINLNERLLAHQNKMKRLMDNLTPGYHIEPWLKNKIANYKNKIQAGKNQSYLSSNDWMNY